MLTRQYFKGRDSGEASERQLPQLQYLWIRNKKSIIKVNILVKNFLKAKINAKNPIMNNISKFQIKDLPLHLYAPTSLSSP